MELLFKPELVYTTNSIRTYFQQKTWVYIDLLVPGKKFCVDLLFKPKLVSARISQTYREDSV
jgi:hypothetical protein